MPFSIISQLSTWIGFPENSWKVNNKQTFCALSEISSLDAASSASLKKKDPYENIMRIRQIIFSGDLVSLKNSLSKDLVLNMGYLLIDLAMEANNKEAMIVLVHAGAPISTEAARNTLSDSALLPILEAYCQKNPIPRDFLGKAIVHKNWITANFLMDQKAPDDGHAIAYAVLYSDSTVLPKSLLNNGYKPNGLALEWACTSEQVDLLLENDAPLSSQALVNMAAKGWDHHVEKLIALGIEIPPQALSGASKNGHLTTVQLLIKHKAPLNNNENYGGVIDSASESKNRDIVTLLLDFGGKMQKNSLAHGITTKDYEWIDYLMELGAPVCIESVRMAIDVNDEVLVRAFMALGAPKSDSYLSSIRCKCSPSLFYYLLSITEIIPDCLEKVCSLESHEHALEFSKALIEKGVAWNPEALRCCVIWGHQAVLEYLIELGIPTDCLYFSDALRRKHYELAFHLLSYTSISIDMGVFDYPLPEDFKSKLFSRLKEMAIQRIGKNHQDPLMEQKLTVIISTYQAFHEKRYLINGRKEDFFEWIETIYQSAEICQTAEIPTQKQMFYLTEASSKTWKFLFPCFDVPKDLEKCSPWGFDLSVYREILPVTLEACRNEGNTNAEINAYKLTVLFGSKERALHYLERAPKTKAPVHDACLFELPTKALWDIEAWRMCMENSHYSIKKMKLLNLAGDMEKRINSALTSYQKVKNRFSETEDAATVHKEIKKVYREEIIKRMSSLPEYKKKLQALKDPARRKTKPKEFNNLFWEACQTWFPLEMHKFLTTRNMKAPIGENKPVAEFLDALVLYRNIANKTYGDLLEIIIQQIYGNIDPKYHEFAYECAAGGILKTHLEEAIETLEKKPKKFSYIPQVKVEGSIIGKPAYVFETMSSKDPMIFILGKKTSCCQSIDGNSRECVLHGATQPYGGFVRIMKNESKDPWVAQSWVGLTEDNELVFDSIENNRGHDRQMILELYALAATAILLKNPKIKRVLFGSGGNTPQNHRFELLSKPLKGYSRIIGYSGIGYDSIHERFILGEQGKLEQKLVDMIGTQELVTESQELTQDRITLIEGTDSYDRPGHRVRGLSLNALDRSIFFENHPKANIMLREISLNPLLEEGYYRSANDREKFGENFLPFAAIKELIEHRARTQTTYKLDHLLLYDNDLNGLTSHLQNIHLAEGQNIFIGWVEEIHATGAYVHKRDGQIQGMIVDPQTPTEDCTLVGCLRSVFPMIQLMITKENLQADLYSCSTFLIKSFMYFAKHGPKIFEKFEGRTPTPLLKMAQKVNFETIGQEVMDEIVSFKKGLTLSQYIQMHQVKLADRMFNAAALRAKYRNFRRLESIISNKR
jgi:hypothetical protein